MKRTIAVFSIGLVFTLLLVFVDTGFAASASLNAGGSTNAKAVQKAPTTTVASRAMYRLYNPRNGEHLYTADANEKNVLKNQRGWDYEGIGWYAPSSSKTPVYRLYSKQAKAHHYTTDANERTTLVRYHGWTYEGIGWYSSDAKQVPIYRVYKATLPLAANHHFTTDAKERATLIARHKWKSEGIAWYGDKAGKSVRDGWEKINGKWRWYNEGTLSKNAWVSTNKLPGKATLAASKQRFRVNANGNLVTGFFKVAGARYYAIPSKGYIVRGKYDYDGDTKLIADSSGKLLTGKGWAVTAHYDGQLQRYYLEPVDGKNKDYYGARMGKFTVSGKQYFGRYDQGYVVRGMYYSPSGILYRADNDGVLQLGTTMSGIDISSWQAGINISRVEADFIIVKATGGTSQYTYTNPYFKTWAKQVLASGKSLGIYHYASGGPDAVTEAKFFLKTIKGYEKKAILVLDWEGDAMKKGPAYAKAWLDYVYKQTGVRPMIYMSRYPTIEYDWSKVAPNYRLWVAEYATPRATRYTQNPWVRNGIGYGAWKQPTLFQYTDSGRISGYSDNLDLDLFYGDKALWNTIAKKG